MRYSSAWRICFFVDAVDVQCLLLYGKVWVGDHNDRIKMITLCIALYGIRTQPVLATLNASTL